MSDDRLDTQEENLAAEDYSTTLDRVQTRTNTLGVSTRSVANAMTKAFAEITVGGKQFDDLLKSMGMQLSKMAVSSAFKPLTGVIDKGLKSLLGELFPNAGGAEGGDGLVEGNRSGCCCCKGTQSGCFGAGGGMDWGTMFSTLRLPHITPFATGGVIGAPGYFPMSGGFGLAGEAGPEAIVPLSRGANGRLGIAGGGLSAASNITVQISTPDADSFRRSEAYVTGQIARAVARGQRGL